MEKIDLVYDKESEIEVTKEFEFESCHHLLEYKGNCKNPHGHSYKLQVTVKGVLDTIGMVLDFKELKSIVKACVITPLDHKDLNEELDFNTTAENMVKWIYDVLDEQVKIYTKDRVRVEKVRLWETSSSHATYRRGR